ncbi:MAG: DUF3999 family protein [Phycisphaerae bacterium]|nr:DUF3999 domain-containing protein [Phycisphaerae bacterium]NIP50730.1 DUF3999 domain-containing protein [Phycisphaerae bacterium]NIS49903.1 DUF3999 domain-containing protein [Phycisphaerae bacterium]NIU07586.1 DUF3999 domain-containing protein [Phycisphaerae bacterium]NIU57052.1 DUF3999 family protein [Phycisphaerae bacterium]
MTKSKNLVIVVLLLGITSNVFALDLAKWKYQAQVTIEEGAGQYCRLTLTPDIYDAARLDLADIRLIDAVGEQIPYVLARPKDIAQSFIYNPAIINRSTKEDKAAMVTLDFGKQVLKNRIEVQTAGDNFRRAVRVEGSNDNIEFFTVVDTAFVFAVDYRTRFEKIDLPGNDYRYLRITVEPMSTEEKSPVINAVRAFKHESKLAERQPVKMVQIEHMEDEKNKSSIYTYDLAYRHLPVGEIELDVADNAFYRYVTIQGRDVATRKVKIDSEDNRQRFKEVEVPWREIDSGTIYRYREANGKQRQNLVLHVPSGRRIYRYLKIVISNYDDKPLTINSTSAKMIADNIVFPGKDDIAPTLYVGSPSAVKPRYDLAQRLNNPLQVKARASNLGAVIDNPLFGQVEAKPLAWTEKHKVLLWIIMGAVVVVLAGFILKSFKTIQTKEAQI